ncbi:TetR/AcrR family transcriptional regulator [Compostimonas suwonensis]|uniref:AcrR family transcriptional regulator n=1 Tax=Compostimonas suwonensis TaxID=1048394 RepID=A0A2M9BBE4_9MICO|nr:TetR/AcrR family transcriptional regulator [Compostimonas suwonensis]PJJ55259.1 AcrR family transcriptional regulator [Compostimonas suwonensis]
MDSSALNDDAPADSARRRRTRDRLVDAAYEVFAEYGVHAASVEMICEHAGFTRGAFYSNFQAKEELFFALMERENTIRIGRLQQGIASFLDPIAGDHPSFGEEVVETIIRQFLELQADDRRWCLVQSEFALLAMRDPSVAGSYRTFQAEFLDQLTAIIVQAIDTVGLRFSIDARSATRLIVGSYEDAMVDSILDPGGPGASERALGELTAVILALTSPSEQGPKALGKTEPVAGVLSS